MSLFEILSEMNMMIAGFGEGCHVSKPELDFTLLTEEEIWGDDNGAGKLDVMKKYGTAVAPTDLAVLLSAYVTSSDKRTSEGDRTCAAWSASSDRDNDVSCVGFGGSEGPSKPHERVVSVRPALSPAESAKISPSEFRVLIFGLCIAEYGEYPQTLADKPTSNRLEDLFQSKSLHPTGKNYTFDSTDLHDYDAPFKATSYPEYELDGKKYIRVPGRPADVDSYLSTGEQVKAEKPYWVQVQPIEWLVDKSGIWVSKKCLFAGIQFDTEKEYNGDFSKTFMKKYLDTYFAKEMGHEEIVAKREQEQEKQRLDKVLTGLSARLEEATNDEAVEAIKKRLTEAEKGKAVKTTPQRLHEAARIKRLRNARDILNEVAQQAYEAGDKALLDGIIDLSSTYAARYQGQQNRVAQRRAVRRTQRKQVDR